MASCKRQTHAKRSDDPGGFGAVLFGVVVGNGDIEDSLLLEASAEWPVLFAIGLDDHRLMVTLASKDDLVEYSTSLLVDELDEGFLLPAGSDNL